MPETASNTQVNVQAEVFKTDADIKERLANIVTEVCKWYGDRFGGVEVGNLDESVRASVNELLGSAVGEAELAHAVSLIAVLRAFFEHCKVLDDVTRNKLINAIDDAISTKEGDKKVLKIPREVLNKARTLVPTAEELREVLLKTLVLNVAKPLTIATLRELAREGRASVVFDARKHRYEFTLKLKNLFTDADAEIIIPISNTTVNTVLKYGNKVDEKPKKSKKKGKEEINRLFMFIPSILEPYAVLFLKHGWVPAFSSLEFIKFLLEMENKEQAVFNTTKDELREVLLKALKSFKFTKVTLQGGDRLYDPLIVDNLKEFVYVDEISKELIVPSRFFTELEVKSGYKSALVNLLAKEGLLKTGHTRYAFARRDKPDEKTTLDVAVFNLDKLRELLGFDPKDLMKTEEFDISKLIELSESKAGGGENETQ
jgi:uroporphyrinogen-III synthase